MIETIITASVLFTNANILTTPMPAIVEFMAVDGGFVGTTTTGVEYRQMDIVKGSIRLQKASIQGAWWYVSDKGVIGVGEGISDLEALSRYLAI